MLKRFDPHCVALSIGRMLPITTCLVAWNAFATEPIVNSLGMRLQPIAAGEFSMGQELLQKSFRSPWSAEKDQGADWDERPVRRVQISKMFHMSATEVTNAQYEQFDPAHHTKRTKSSAQGDDAVVNVSWHDAVRFSAWLSEKEGRTYRLPTEAEWEYACRAGSSTRYSYGNELPVGYQPMVPGQLFAYPHFFRPDNPMPNYYRVQESMVSLRVGQRPANAWGLFDLHGNVEEWCYDWYAPYSLVETRDPRGAMKGDFKVTRGGATSQFARLLSSANRSSMVPSIGAEMIGFRVVLGEALTEPTSAYALPPSHQTITAASAEVNPSEPFYRGPQEYVHIPPGSMGPIFSKHNHDPAVAVCANGDVLAIWYTCEEEPGTELAVVSSRLRAGATEWEPAQIFWDSADRNDHGPALWLDEKEGLLFHFNGLKQIYGSIVRTSRDNGYTWSDATVYSRGTQANEANLRTRDDRILATVDGPHQSTILEESTDGGKSWRSLSNILSKPDFRPGQSGPAIAGIHAGMVELKDGSLLALGRLDAAEAQRGFEGMNPQSISQDGGKTWHYSSSVFPAISSGQRFTLKRLREGPLLLCTYTEMRVKKDDFGRVIGAKPFAERVGMAVTLPSGEKKVVHGLIAAVSFDEGKTWPVKRLLTPGGEARQHPGTDGGKFTIDETQAELSGYLAMAQDRKGGIHLVSSRNYYHFNLAWLTQAAPVN